MSLCSVLRKVAAGTYIGGHFLYMYLDDCRMDSSLVRRYLCAIYPVIGDIKLRSIDICLNKYNIILIIV